MLLPRKPSDNGADRGAHSLLAHASDGRTCVEMHSQLGVPDNEAVSGILIVVSVLLRHWGLFPFETHLKSLNSCSCGWFLNLLTRFSETHFLRVSNACKAACLKPEKEQYGFLLPLHVNVTWANYSDPSEKRKSVWNFHSHAGFKQQ